MTGLCHQDECHVTSTFAHNSDRRFFSRGPGDIRCVDEGALQWRSEELELVVQQA